ncbi:hypothetical protein L249_2468 [Ophiocordyceps polyrhachis-furcata BCC 54312]|uniref:Uncharacterized protein n=1 Tax=Ophiocordyceps polyrhachis-furcata BCC 54312 TaxID=1330021 RepID=A0A367LSF6_9HYPO|nr:hypothetical protein L249_2468 [Ophiocordyceps polyrhachis-furcata BCC 54312]
MQARIPCPEHTICTDTILPYHGMEKGRYDMPFPCASHWPPQRSNLPSFGVQTEDEREESEMKGPINTAAQGYCTASAAFVSRCRSHDSFIPFKGKHVCVIPSSPPFPFPSFHPPPSLPSSLTFPPACRGSRAVIDVVVVVVVVVSRLSVRDISPLPQRKKKGVGESEGDASSCVSLEWGPTRQKKCMTLFVSINPYPAEMEYYVKLTIRTDLTRL